jgi:tetratricopeptide (TPR) repeat protein
VERAQDGQIVVRADRAMTFERVAEEAYGVASLGPSVALAAGLSYRDGVPAGAVVVLPPRAELDAQVRRGRETEELFQRGLSAAASGSYLTATGHFRDALRQSPGRIDIQYNLGLALFHAGELNDATRILESVAKKRPDDPDARYAFGSVLRRWREHDRALDEFDAALRADRNHAGAAFARAKTLEDLGRSDRAVRAWEDFLQRFPKDPLAASARESLTALRQAPSSR